MSFLLATGVSATANAQWSPLTTGQTTGYIMDYIRYNSDIYACGSITKIGGTSVNSVAKWNGTQWQPVGNTFTEWVHKLEPIGTDLFAMPYNTTADSNHIYKWDGSQWNKYAKGFYLTNTNLGSYHASSLYDAIEYNGKLIVCGEFDRAGSNNISGIAEWNGSDWSALGTGLTDPITGLNIYPHKMFLYNSNLYVVGNFKKAGGVTVNGVAYWDGSNWHAMGDGFNSAVYGIEEYKGSLYACGEFTKSGSDDLYSIAKWDGAKWVNAGISLTTDVPGYKAFGHTLKKVGDLLYVSGGFDQCIDANMQIVPGNNVLEYDGNSWYAMDGGTDGDLEGIIDYGNGQVLFGGGYTKAGNITVNSMSLWHSTVNVLTLISNNKISLYPCDFTIIAYRLEKFFF
ncbi:MAG: hypothetical protein EOP51_12715 [Sphingobacteriales bacterium]|nr:MAG: hypothetical protein EOP51_12715 [Sphingobacteriales bacterium]